MNQIKSAISLAALGMMLTMSTVNPEPVTIYLIGDSTMSDKKAEAYPETGWGMPFTQFFDSTVTVENHAKNGRSTRTFWEEGRWEPIRTRLKEGDYVFIQFGHNDEVETKEQHTSEENFKANLAKYVSEARDKGAKPVLLTPVARRIFEGGKLVDTHEIYSELMREVARSEEVPLIDIDQKSRELLRDLGPEKSRFLYNHLKPGEHDNYPDGIADNTHFSKFGAQRMAELVVDGIRNLNLDLVDRVTAAGETRLLWPEDVPDAMGSTDRDQPAVTVFMPEEKKLTGTGVVVFPGGGYSHLAMDHEGYQVARWLNELGITAFVVKYRLGERYRHPVQLGDAQRAIQLVRSKAQSWGVGNDKIGILGFSAGGHLASTAGTHFWEGNPNAKDLADQQSSRPDFMILIYPVITMQSDYTHQGSRYHLLGENPDLELIELLSNEKQVTDKTPPTFIVHGSNDSGVPVQNSVQFYLALQEHDIPAEMHLFEDGPHGFGLAPNDPVLSHWTTLCERWMKSRGLLNK